MQQRPEMLQMRELCKYYHKENKMNKVRFEIALALRDIHTTIELSNITGISRQTLSAIRNESVEASQESAEQIRKTLDLSDNEYAQIKGQDYTAQTGESLPSLKVHIERKDMTENAGGGCHGKRIHARQENPHEPYGKSGLHHVESRTQAAITLPHGDQNVGRPRIFRASLSYVKALDARHNIGGIDTSQAVPYDRPEQIYHAVSFSR